MSGPFSNAAFFLLKTLSDLALLLFLLRLLLQWSGTDFYNPISQIVFRATNPLLAPLQRLTPRSRWIDLPCAIVLILVAALTTLLLFAIEGVRFGIFNLAILSIARILNLAIMVYIIAIIGSVILSWVNPGGYHPVSRGLDGLTRPILTPLRRIIPPLGGLDFSPLIAILLLQTLFFFIPSVF